MKSDLTWNLKYIYKPFIDQIFHFDWSKNYICLFKITQWHILSVRECATWTYACLPWYLGSFLTWSEPFWRTPVLDKYQPLLLLLLPYHLSWGIAMVSSLLSPLSDTVLHSSPPKITVSEKPATSQKKTQLGFTKKPSWTSPLLQKSIPLAASVAILLWSNPGILQEFLFSNYFIYTQNDVVLIMNWVHSTELVNFD